MLRTRIKRNALHDARTMNRLADIEASILALKDDDLLDLADIFSDDPQTPLARLAAAEMARRNITL
ncbi:hypothetical protein EAH84_07345 [Sphingomonas oligophenolica]|uniref:Uncharacterized protein n=1 Tax=Sphingomonas oligophenolica TaxID=301154 RepID=A0A502CHS9_9SPHN|nr:hypothetical protein EAH84_07345 [Sphingomonas oligophenolica]